MRPGLERIRALLAACGEPQRAVSLVQVAGTNGKGSVCAMVESVLRAAGFATGAPFAFLVFGSSGVSAAVSAGFAAGAALGFGDKISSSMAVNWSSSF